MRGSPLARTSRLRECPSPASGQRGAGTDPMSPWWLPCSSRADPRPRVPPALAKMSMTPSGPTGTVTRFGTAPPASDCNSSMYRLETSGRGAPCGHTVQKPAPNGATAVRFSTAAVTVPAARQRSGSGDADRECSARRERPMSPGCRRDAATPASPRRYSWSPRPKRRPRNVTLRRPRVSRPPCRGPGRVPHLRTRAIVDAWRGA